jgi:UDP-N-acetyl-D-mannosaminuronate dehydrogenase
MASSTAPGLRSCGSTVGRAARPAELHGAHCAAYDAVQAERYDPERIMPDHVENEEFAQHGLLCAHPSVAGLVVQVFYNERFVRGQAPVRRVTTEEMRGFFEGVRWTQ